MSKSIDTLVSDIYGLFDGSHNFSSESVSAFGERLATHLASRIEEERGAPTLRLSNLGQPDRKLWYTINTPELGETLSPKTRFKFLIGDLLEELLLFLAEESGHDVQGAQDELEINGVKGHRDAVIDGRVVDVKSASSFSFKKFKEHRLREDDPFGYINQLNSYLFSSKNDPLVTDRENASFLAIDKTLGHIVLDTYSSDGVDYNALVEKKRKMLQSPTTPPRCYDPVPEGKSGNMKLGTQCSYCNFKSVCYPGLRTFLYSTGPVYLTEVVREPKVPEITGAKIED